MQYIFSTIIEFEIIVLQIHFLYYPSPVDQTKVSATLPGGSNVILIQGKMSLFILTQEKMSLYPF